MSHGTIFERLGQLEAVPVTAAEDAGLLNSRHLGKLATITDTVGIPYGIWKANDFLMIMNTTATPLLIYTGGGGLVMKLEGSGLTGGRTLAAYSQCSLWFESPSIVWITGGGVS